MLEVLDYLFLDIPEAFINIFVAISLYNISIKNKMKRLFVISIFLGMFTKLTELQGALYEYKAPVFIMLMSIAIFVLFKTKLSSSIIMSVGTAIVFICVELIAMLILYLFGVDLTLIMHDKKLMFIAMWLVFSLQLSIVYLLRKTNFDLRKYLPKSKLNIYFILSIILIIFELFAIVELNVRSFLIKEFNFEIMTYNNVPIWNVVVLILFVGIIFTLYKYQTLKIEKAEKEAEEPYIKNYQDLVLSLRTVKHDVANHLTVISNLVANKDYDEVNAYINDLVQDVHEVVTKIQGVKNPAVSALLQSKREMCKGHDIKFDLDIQSISQLEYIKTNDIITILANVLDNAIKANCEIENDRFISIKWIGSNKEEKIVVENRCNVEARIDTTKMFEFGYTSKEGGGTGLAAVRKIVTKHRGRVNARHDKNIFVIEVNFPKQKTVS